MVIFNYSILKILFIFAAVMKRFGLILFIFFLSISNSGVFHQDHYVVIDSNISFEEATEGISIPPPIKENLVLIDVLYYSFDGKLHKGQLLIHHSLEKDISDIFSFIRETKFPVEKVIPISRYNWNDSLSMSDNNSSAFNYRRVKGSRNFSSHSTGKAIDINPLLNPQYKNGISYPHNTVYDTSVRGTISGDSPLVELFKKKGWRWGGNWRSTRDYQHFEKL
jgi:peptidoglycan LD-endopeptidase CwlK